MVVAIVCGHRVWTYGVKRVWLYLVDILARLRLEPHLSREIGVTRLTLPQSKTYSVLHALCACEMMQN